MVRIIDRRFDSKNKSAVNRQRFMRRFNVLPAMASAPARAQAPRLTLSAEESLQAISAVAMRCGG